MAEERNSLLINNRQEDEFVVVPVAEMLHTVCDYELSFRLSKFIHEIRKQMAHITLQTRCTKFVSEFKDI